MFLQIETGGVPVTDLDILMTENCFPVLSVYHWWCLVFVLFQGLKPSR